MDTPASRRRVAASSAGAPAGPGRAGLPQASARMASSTAGGLPHPASAGPATTCVASRPVVRPEPVSATSTSMVWPGTATEAPAGVPVSTTSPGSSVMNRDRSATSSPKPNSRSAVESSCTSSPSSHTRSASPAGSTAAAGSSSGPTGANPSPPLDRTLDPESARRRSCRPRSSAAVTQPTWDHPCAGVDPTGRGADDQGDLALEGEQLGAGGPLDRAGPAQRGGGLEEVGRVRGGPAALGGPGRVVLVDGHHLAGPEAEDPGDRVGWRRRAGHRKIVYEWARVTAPARAAGRRLRPELCI